MSLQREAAEGGGEAMRPERFGAGALAVWFILSRVGAPTAGAQTPCAAAACSEPNCFVNDASGVDAPGCCTLPTPCKTIQFAVGQASPGDVIKVAAGTYPESAVVSLSIGKTVTLCGAQAGVDART